MKMIGDNEKYDKMIEILRNSRPELFRPEEIEDEVIKRIRREKSMAESASGFIEALFGWVYIGWVRRSLIGVAFVLIAVFIYQQASILKQVNNISNQVVFTGIGQGSTSLSEIDKKLTIYKISSGLSGDREIKISETQLEELLDSYQDLQGKYKDLLRIIEENPELNKYIEKRLDEEKNNKPDL
jgi:DNA gyrase/topoisomerase IV subunit A